MILEEVNESFFTTLFEFTPVPHGLFMANHEEGREREEPQCLRGILQVIISPVMNMRVGLTVNIKTDSGHIICSKFKTLHQNIFILLETTEQNNRTHI